MPPLLLKGMTLWPDNLWRNANAWVSQAQAETVQEKTSPWDPAPFFFLVLMSGLNPCEPDVLEASVSAVPHVDIFESKCNPESSWLLVEVSQCWSATNMHPEPPQPPVLRLQFSCLVLIRFWSASLGLSESCPFKLALISARDACFSGHQIHTFTCTMREACGCYTPLLFLYRLNATGPPLPTAKNMLWEWEEWKGGFLWLVEKEARFGCLHEGLCGGVTEGCGWI